MMEKESPPGRRCGARALPDGSVAWRVWAPNAGRVDLVVFPDGGPERHPMEPEGRGYYSYRLPQAPAGLRYTYSLDGGPDRPDPASLWQPDGPHAASAVFDLAAHAWGDGGWRGVAREDLVLYELHVGTFTPEGTLDAVIPRLDALRDLGVTAVELMPLAQFPGPRNWGYDGVQWYAVQNSYGGPRALQRLVDAAHQKGLAVFLDVVYNHAGPEGNYLAQFGPYFTDRYRTGWGPALNYDAGGSDAVRDFVLDNARMWVEEFHVDGLRLDAVHAIYDQGAHPILQAIQETVAAAAARRGRPVHVVAESDLNDPRLLRPVERGGCGVAAQWADDFHHAVHAYFTGETQGYYADYGRPQDIAAVLRQPYFRPGEYSPYRDRKHGAPPTGLAGDRFVVFIQNHDQVGNRARGDRLGAQLTEPAQRLTASLLLLSPYLPLLFMGQEYGEPHPFAFFCSFGDAALIEAVRQGRRREFAAFGWQDDVPDPQAESTFAASRLTWAWPAGSFAAGLRQLYADLLAARRAWPPLRDFARRAVRLHPSETEAAVLELVSGSEGPSENAVQAYFNLTNQPQPMPSASAEQAVLFRSESTRYGGRQDGSTAELLPHECLVRGPRWLRSFR